MGIVEFLTARLDDEERMAKAAIGTAVFQSQTGRWLSERVLHTYGSSLIVFAVANGGGRTQAADLSAAWDSESRAEFIAYHDPARVLADVAAKRRIIELHTGQHDCAGSIDNSTAWPYVGCDTLRLLAQPCKDHPDYDAEAWSVQQ
jgi:hypothetical protein